MTSHKNPSNRPSVASPEDIELLPPSLGVRLGIVLYEAFLLFSVLLLGFIPFVLLTNSTEGDYNTSFNRIFTIFILGLYFTYQWAKGKTLAMQTWRVIICNADGTRLTRRTALCRYLLCWPLTITLIGWVWMFFDPERQLLQDRLLKTRMYRMTVIQR